MKFTKLICLVLVLMLSFSLLGACGGDSGKTSSNTSENADEFANQVLSKSDINYIDDDGESMYRIVRPYQGTTATTNAGKSVIQSLKNVCGVSAKSVTDEEDGADAAEIIIGNTSRDSTDKAKKLLSLKGTGRSNEFIICAIDNDIVLYAENEDALTNAVKYFCENYIKSETITGGIFYIYISNEGFADISILGLSNISSINIVRPIYNVSWITQNETDKLISYILEKTGYNLKLTNDQVASTNYLERPEAVSDGSGTLTPTTPAEYEIIIGNCVRDGVKTSFSDYDEFEIRIEDKKIFLNGKTPYATAMAVSEFLRLVQNNTAITKDMSVASGNYKQSLVNYDSSTYYKVTWFDEFDGTAIDESKWNIHWDEPCYTKNTTTNKMGYRGNSASRNNYVKDGALYFDAMETSDSYYGGKLTTSYMMDYLYGYTEISNIHPVGNGFWVALYPITGVTAPDDLIYGNEIDIDECYGHTGNWVYQNTFASPTPYGKNFLGIPADQGGHILQKNDYYSKDDRGTWMDFHTYGSNWISKEKVVFTVDGYVTFTNNLNNPAEQQAYSTPSQLFLCMSVGSEQQGHEPSGSKAWYETNSYIVDYVYIYQLKGHEMYINEGGNKNNRIDNWQTIVID